ncbi:MAG: gliding motility-associated ABC transporter ATP-binding subunit GldA [Bernardetiaceae bacterium]|jgi:ABC-2 type transport system ATP-binding protein|nr:gliding motility-associated ABC transporter ATP-binding subunit GldA [Bernardetiaceae bacterium]
MSLVVDQLTKMYGPQRAVDGISFSVSPGEIVGFLGPNGAGKSTTMKVATCYLPPSAGTVAVCGHDVQRQPLEVRRAVGYLPEHNPLYLDMYVREYLRFVGQLHRLGGADLARRTEQMLELCGLGREQHKKIGALSKGYRQRVGLAQALLHDPPVLILDEPTTGLDPNQIVEIRQVIKGIAANKTVVLSTHIMQEVQALCQRAIIINLGRIVADSPVAELRGAGGSVRIAVEFDRPVPEAQLAQLAGLETAQPGAGHRWQLTCAHDLRPDLARLAQEHGWLILGMQMEESSLENVFQQLTKNAPEA